jgi:SAM-dependent methyltransferase
MALAPDIATLETLAFVKGALPPRSRRVLEVGCGDGTLAAHFAASKLEVVAIDTKREHVMAARARGIDARVAEFPDFDTAAVDAVIFTRSLHHVQRLEAAVDRAAELLKPGGRVIVEDWAHDELDAATAEWAYGTFATLRAAGIDSGAEFQSDGNALASWNAEHGGDHLLHGGKRIAEALGRRFVAQVRG